MHDGGGYGPGSGEAGRGAGWELGPDRARQGFFAILRLYSPTEAFFDKSWRASEIRP